MNHIRVELAEDGLTAKLLEDFTACIRGLCFTVPAGFVTDFASVPQFLWWIIPPWGPYCGAALVHDYLYSKQLYSRRIADAVFLELMKDAGVPWWKRTVMWLGVRLGGGRRYKPP